MLGKYEQALQLLRKSLALGVPERKRLWILNHDSDWAELRKEKRFAAVFQS